MTRGHLTSSATVADNQQGIPGNTERGNPTTRSVEIVPANATSDGAIGKRTSRTVVGNDKLVGGKKMKLSKGISSVAALVLAAALAACSSSSGGSSNSSGPSGRTTLNKTSTGTAASGSPIKIGMLCSCSGSAVTPAIEGAGNVVKAWAKSTNAVGGIAGHPIDLAFKDDGGVPGTAVTAAQSLISEHVAAIIDESNFRSAWEQAVDKAGIPVIGGTIASPPYDEDPNFYPSGQTIGSTGYALVLTAKRAGATKIAQLYCAEAPVCKNATASNKAASRKLGLPVAYYAAISATAPNYTAQCIAAQQAGASAMLIADTASIVARVAKDCAAQGYTPIYVMTGEAYNQQMAATPGLKDNLWVTFAIRPFFTDHPAVQKMNRAIDKYYPKLRKNPIAWSGIPAEAWTAGVLIEKAVEASRAGASADITAALVRKGLNSLHEETLDGLSPPLTFTAGKPHPVNCWFTARVKSGKPMLANTGKLTCKNGTTSQ